MIMKLWVVEMMAIMQLGDESQNRPHPIKNLPRELYMSCGCIATSSDEFLDDWV